MSVMFSPKSDFSNLTVSRLVFRGKFWPRRLMKYFHLMADMNNPAMLLRSAWTREILPELCVFWSEVSRKYSKGETVPLVMGKADEGASFRHALGRMQSLN